MSDDENGVKKAPKKRGPGRPFPPGSPGRPKGSRNKRTVLAEQIMSEDLEAITRAVSRAALQGDVQAARVVLDRLVPIRRGRPVEFPKASAEIGTAGAIAESF